MFLRGVGVTMALPWMESLAVWGDQTRAARAASQAPVRLAVLFSGNGFHSREWWAKGSGSQMQLGKVLAPLADFREKMVFIRGLFNAEALKGNIHSSQTGNLLSGAPLASGGEIHSGTSIDQLVAQLHGRSTKVPSLVLACEKSNPSVHKNYSMLYSSHISWSSPTTPTPLELYPSLAFDRLFKDEVGRGDRSVLDAVLSDAKSFRLNISSSDQRKFDEYLDSVREIEQRIEQAGKRGSLEGWRPTLAKPNIRRPADGIPQNIADHMRLMCDHPRAGLPDRRHARLHAQAQQRPQLAAVSAFERRLHDSPSVVALRHGRLAEGEPVLPAAGRLMSRGRWIRSAKASGRCSTTRCSCTARAC